MLPEKAAAFEPQALWVLIVRDLTGYDRGMWFRFGCGFFFMRRCPGSSI